MALIRQTSIDAVRDAVDIVELVQARTPLRRVGSRWVGRCPFHEERTPSFSVSADKKTYYCFGCQRGGDVFRFVQETEGLDFAQAVETLADRYRVELEYEEGGRPDDGGRRRRERLLSLLEDAARFYERTLWEGQGGEEVRAYLASRGLDEEASRSFRLGLSPGGDVLPRKATREGLHARGAHRCRPRQPTRQRLLRLAAHLSACRPPGSGARLRREAALRRRSDQGEVRQHAGDRAVPERRDRLRARPRAAGDRQAGPGRRGRGLHGRASPSTRPGSSRPWPRWAPR